MQVSCIRVRRSGAWAKVLNAICPAAVCGVRDQTAQSLPLSMAAGAAAPAATCCQALLQPINCLMNGLCDRSLPPVHTCAAGVGHINADTLKKHMPPPEAGNLVLVCGPPPMYKAISGQCSLLLVESFRIPAYLTLAAVLSSCQNGFSRPKSASILLSAPVSLWCSTAPGAAHRINYQAHCVSCHRREGQQNRPGGGDRRSGRPGVQARARLQVLIGPGCACTE